MDIFDWFNDKEVTVTNEMNAHDITCYTLIGVLILVVILFIVYHKCKELHKADLALNEEITELREIIHKLLKVLLNLRAHTLPINNNN